MLKAEKIVKEFPGLRALNDVNFEVKKGEVHILFGENGAGKSTLINILAGVLQPDRGWIKCEERVIQLPSRRAARDLGIAAVFQEFSLAPDLTVEENLVLGAEPRVGPFLRHGLARARAGSVIEKTGFGLDPSVMVRDLSRSEQQKAEIAKALMSDVRILILDEPTASFTHSEAEKLFSLVAELKLNGVAIIYITHRIEELAVVGDRITVLRDGEVVCPPLPANTSHVRLVELMTGQSHEEFFPKVKHAPTTTLIETNSITGEHEEYQSVSFEVKRGEIVGMAGLAGSGKSQIGRACFGVERSLRGQIKVNGQEITRPSPRQMLDLGFFYTPPDRIREGILRSRSARENMTLASVRERFLSIYGILNRSAEVQCAQQLGEQVGLRPLLIEREARYFSGGNLQKMILANALGRSPNCIILDDPTVGIDLGTKRRVYELLRQLAESQRGVLLISSDLAEIVHLSHRVYVIADGKVAAHLQREQVTEENVLKHFF